MSKMQRIEQAFSHEHGHSFNVGDSVDVHVLIREGEKERVQIFSGTVIRKKGGGLTETYTVRRIVQSQGVERTFPMNSPFIQKVDVKRSGKTRRSRLYYLRDRTGKATRLKEIMGTRPEKKPRVRRQRKKAGVKAAPAPAPAAPAAPVEETPTAEE